MRRTLLAVLALAALSAPPASHAATRYATPAAGAGADCTEAKPCSLPVAVFGAQSGDTVLIGAGTYGSPEKPLDLPAIDTDTRALTLAGAVTGPGRPVLHPLKQFILGNPASAVRDLHIRRAGFVLAVDAGTADRVVAEVLGTGDGDACQVRKGTLSNSVCIERHPTTSSALAFQADGPGAARNVTLAGAGYGLYVNSGGAVTVANSVLQGASRPDVYVNFGQLTLIDDAYQQLMGDAPVSETGTVSAAPVFRGAEDFRPVASSPTVDAGSDAESAGDLDLGGNVRRIGSAVDIGAFELVPAPPAIDAPTATATSATTATVATTLRPQGGLVTYRLDYGATSAYGSSTPERTLLGTMEAPVSFALSGLPADGTVHYRIVASTDGGTTETADAAFSTPPLPPAAGEAPAPPAGPPVRPPAIPPAFTPKLSLGVSSGRFASHLLLGRRAVSLSVSCGAVACRASATGAVYAGRRRLGRLSASRAVNVAAGRRGTVRLHSSASLRRKVRTHLARRRPGRIEIRLAGTFVGPAGERRTRNLTVRVRRLKR